MYAISVPFTSLTSESPHSNQRQSNINAWLLSPIPHQNMITNISTCSKEYCALETILK